MKRGFTIIELLVASMLLGMLLTVLTMLFNQSSISWRTGEAGVADLDDVRNNIAEVREEADNAYIWNDELHRLTGLWRDDGQLRTRAWDVGAEDTTENKANYLRARGGAFGDATKLSSFKIIGVGSGDGGGGIKTYIVNVKSAGPNRAFESAKDKYSDDIWSFPDASLYE